MGYQSYGWESLLLGKGGFPGGRRMTKVLASGDSPITPVEKTLSNGEIFGSQFASGRRRGQIYSLIAWGIGLSEKTD